MLFLVALFLLSFVTGGLAAVVGFGIGSFLTPVMALRTSFAVAVAAVGVAHLLGSAVRWWILRQEINRRVLLSFGALSAIGGLVGALLQGRASASSLTLVFGGLMILAGVLGFFNLQQKLKINGSKAWAIGAVSGFFGGLVGNQGGLRAVGLLGFGLSKTEFVATATAVAFAIDIFRVPVYIASRSADLAGLLPAIGVMSAGVVIGTIAGAPLLRRLPERSFRTTLSIVLVVVGVLVASK